MRDDPLPEGPTLAVKRVFGGAMVLVVAIAVALVVVEVRSRSAWRDVEIVQVSVDGDSTRIGASVASCLRRDRITVTETPETITIAARSQGGPDGPECLDGWATACLETPIGDRRVVDDLTGERVPLATTDTHPIDDHLALLEPCP